MVTPRGLRLSAHCQDDGSVFAQDNVWCAGEPAHVDPVAVATRVQVTAHEHLGLGVFALDA